MDNPRQVELDTFMVEVIGLKASLFPSLVGGAESEILAPELQGVGEPLMVADASGGGAGGGRSAALISKVANMLKKVFSLGGKAIRFAGKEFPILNLLNSLDKVAPAIWDALLKLIAGAHQDLRDVIKTLHQDGHELISFMGEVIKKPIETVLQAEADAYARVRLTKADLECKDLNAEHDDKASPHLNAIEYHPHVFTYPIPKQVQALIHQNKTQAFPTAGTETDVSYHEPYRL